MILLYSIAPFEEGSSELFANTDLDLCYSKHMHEFVVMYIMKPTFIC